MVCTKPVFGMLNTYFHLIRQPQDFASRNREEHISGMVDREDFNGPKQPPKSFQPSIGDGVIIEEQVKEACMRLLTIRAGFSA